MSEHPWLLLGAAWSWGTADARASRPALQKYDTSDPVKPFTADPTAFLPFGAEDVVYDLVDDSTFSRTTTRKLYLDSHKRFYLLACELHCDAAGLPNAERAQACETGFVVRRRRVVFPVAERREAVKLLKRLADSRVKVETLEQDCGCAPRVAVVPRATAPARAVALKLDQARVEVEERQTDLSLWFEGAGGLMLLEGWVPDPAAQGVGRWEVVDDEPQETAEAVFPLYPLVPDPRNERHAARGRTAWFGLVPTAGSEHLPDGTPRFDDLTQYEARCFVRRHREHCDRKAERNDCHGPLFWSRPTEAYRLASQFDLHGTSNRPVTIQMPDLPALVAQAKALPHGPLLTDGTHGPVPRGCGKPVRWVSPKGSLPGMSISPPLPVPTPLGLTGQLTMLSAIPLHTIVGQFVFNIFKPIVTLLFGLIPLLALKIFVPSVPNLDPALLAMLGNIQGDTSKHGPECPPFTEPAT